MSLGRYETVSDRTSAWHQGFTVTFPDVEKDVCEWGAVTKEWAELVAKEVLESSIKYVEGPRDKSITVTNGDSTT